MQSHVPGPGGPAIDRLWFLSGMTHVREFADPAVGQGNEHGMPCVLSLSWGAEHLARTVLHTTLHYTTLHYTTLQYTTLP